MNRRDALHQTALLGAICLDSFSMTAKVRKHYKIGACDWSLGRACTPEVFAYAQKIGLEGVQLSYNSRKYETYLLRPENQQAMREASKKSGVKIASLAIGQLNSVPLKSELKTVEWVSGSIDAAKALGVKVVLLAFFSKGDLRNDDAGKKVVIERLKQLAPKAEKQGVILAIGQLNSVPLKSEPKTVEWVSGSIDAAKALGVKVVLLAFFSNGDLRNDDTGKKVVIERLKQLAPKAEKQGVILAIESYLSAQEHLDIIDAVGSRNIQVYYDPRNAADAGHDPYTEILMLGKRKLICEVHLKENEFLLGQGSIDWPRIRQLLDEINFKGWAHIEGAVPKGKTIDESYPLNVSYAKKIFG